MHFAKKAYFQDKLRPHSLLKLFNYKQMQTNK